MGSLASVFRRPHFSALPLFKLHFFKDNPRVSTAFLSIAILISSLALGATGKTATVFGRAEVQGARTTPTCKVCIGCEGFSGGVKKTIECGKSAALIDGLKYRLKLTPTLVDGKCELKLAEPPELLPPEAKLPVYPKQKELEVALECGKEGL